MRTRSRGGAVSAIGWLVLAAMGCGEQSPTSPPADVGTPSGPPLEASLKTDKAVYKVGEPVKLEFTITNRSAQPIPLQFRSGQRYNFRIEDQQDQEGRSLWNWEEGRVFSQALGEDTLAPRTSLVYSVESTGSLVPGEYRARGILTAINQPITASADIKVQ